MVDLLVKKPKCRKSKPYINLKTTNQKFGNFQR